MTESEPDPGSGLLSSREAAELVSAALSTLVSWAREGHLPVAAKTFTRRGSGVKWWFRAEDVLAFVASKRSVPRGWLKSRNREPSAAEVEALVAAQMRCLPDYWERDVRESNRDRELPRMVIDMMRRRGKFFR